MLSVTYIHHSSFLVETDHVCLLFDYYQGRIPVIPHNKPLYVFASHVHGDHYHKKIYTIKHPRITYILSYDIPASDIPKGSHVIRLKPHEDYHDACLAVKTYTSNDEGVAFWCQADGYDIYHAGDLNDWDWIGEDQKWLDWQKNLYHEEINRMPRHASLAFVVLDGRLEDNEGLGLDYFLKNIDADTVFPMHFWGDYGIISRFKKTLPASYAERIMDITHKNQTFIVKN